MSDKVFHSLLLIGGMITVVVIDNVLRHQLERSRYKEMMSIPFQIPKQEPDEKPETNK